MRVTVHNHFTRDAVLRRKAADCGHECDCADCSKAYDRFVDSPAEGSAEYLVYLNREIEGCKRRLSQSNISSETKSQLKNYLAGLLVSKRKLEERKA